jgi:hypothetical protein
MQKASKAAAMALLKDHHGQFLPWHIQEQCREMVSTPGLRDAMEKVVFFATQLLGPERLTGWLGTPKVALRGDTPAMSMKTIPGCRSVWLLLKKIEANIAAEQEMLH